MGERMPGRNRVEAFESSHSKELEPELNSSDLQEWLSVLVELRKRTGDKLFADRVAFNQAVGRLTNIPGFNPRQVTATIKALLG